MLRALLAALNFKMTYNIELSGRIKHINNAGTKEHGYRILDKARMLTTINGIQRTGCYQLLGTEEVLMGESTDCRVNFCIETENFEKEVSKLPVEFEIYVVNELVAVGGLTKIESITNIEI